MKSFFDVAALIVVFVVVLCFFNGCVKSQCRNNFQNGNSSQNNRRVALAKTITTKFILNYTQQHNFALSESFANRSNNVNQYGQTRTRPCRNTSSTAALPFGRLRRHWRGPHRPSPNRYRDFAAVFHELERNSQADDYNSSAEEDDLNDDFNGRSIVAPGQYPHMVALGFSDKDSVTFICGGSLISDTFVLTAAHCCNYNGEALQIVELGDINLRRRETDIRPQRRLVAQFYVYPDYNASLYYHDIALVQLTKPVDYTRFVRPIRLWAKHEIPYEKVFTMGYGSTSFAQAPTHILTELELTIVPVSKCNQTLPVDASAPLGILESQICAKDFEKNRDTCQGDSGGPLQLNLERRRRRRQYRYYLVGIISYGDFCRSQHPGVYTRVSSYIDWIASIVWPDYFKHFS